MEKRFRCQGQRRANSEPKLSSPKGLSLVAWAVPLHPLTPPHPHPLSAHTQSQSGTLQGPEGPQELVQTTGDF